jgi:hypothetical protein
MRQRVDERHRPHQVRGELLQQEAALAQRLGDEAEVEHLQVAQAAVDQLARPAGRAGREVAGLHQADAEPPGGRVEGRAATDHTAADDQDVERLRAHGVEGGFAVLR